MSSSVQNTTGKLTLLCNRGSRPGRMHWAQNTTALHISNARRQLPIQSLACRHVLGRAPTGGRRSEMRCWAPRHWGLAP